MAQVVRLSSADVSQVPAQRVFWKARWLDPWEQVPALWCDYSEWSAAPAMPVAGFRWDYGMKHEPGDVLFGPRFRENNRLRFYVRVEWSIYGPGQFGVYTTRNWYGFIDLENDEQHGPLRETIEGETITVATGVNQFTAYGLEALLDCQRIRSSYVYSPTAGEYWVNRGLEFNRYGLDRHVLGNRSQSLATTGGYAFHGTRENSDAWSTRDIVDYLVRRQTPRDNGGTAQIPFVLYDPDGVLPFWDEPVLPQDGRTTRELLNMLMARERARSYYCDVEPAAEKGLPDVVRIRPFSFASELIALVEPSGASLPANSDQIQLAFEFDRGAACVTKRSSVDQFDRVIARGARRTSTATFSFDDATLAKGWPDALELEYEAAASLADDYGGLSVDDKITRNILARQADRLKPVYARFVIPDPFTYVVGDGLGEPAEYLTPNDDNPEAFVRLAPQDLRFLPHLAIRKGFDYSSASVTITTPDAHHWLEPIVLFRRDDWTDEAPRYFHAESAGMIAESESAGVESMATWSAQVRVDHEDGSLWVILASNTDQCAIAKSDFTPLADDLEYGASDYQHMLVTASVPWSEFVEVAYPAELPIGNDVIRTYTIDAGDEFRLDYIAPDTVTGVVPGSGALVKSPGGFVRDDRRQLAGIAELAYHWYSRTRRAVTLDTTHMHAALTLGQLITSIGDPDIEGDVHLEEINSCITSLRISAPQLITSGLAPARPPLPYLTLRSDFGELDVIAVGAGK